MLSANTNLEAGNRSNRLRAFLVCGLMIAASISAFALKPRPQDGGVPVEARLEQIVPVDFNGWKLEPTQGGFVVSPDVQETLGKIYSETLSRTYVSETGDRIMLSLAYGGSQSRELQIHKPEVCYAAQGFRLLDTQLASLQLNGRDVPVMRIVAQAANRREPITYWIRSGDYLVRGWFEQNKVRITYGLRGLVPDGLLVRVSSISDDSDAAFRVQERFLDDLLKNLADQDKPMFLGRSAN